MANATIARSKFVPLIDITRGAEAGVHTWKPIDLSTVFELAYNPQTETYGYICNDTDSTEIKSYQPAMEQEIKISRGNPIYDFMLDFMRGMPTGSAAEVPVMVVYPDKTTGEATDADLWEHAVIYPGTINTVDGKLTFTLNFNGAHTQGTVTGLGTETIKFAEAAA